MSRAFRTNYFQLLENLNFLKMLTNTFIHLALQIWKTNFKSCHRSRHWLVICSEESSDGVGNLESVDSKYHPESPKTIRCKRNCCMVNPLWCKMPWSGPESFLRNVPKPSPITQIMQLYCDLKVAKTQNVLPNLATQTPQQQKETLT